MSEELIWLSVDEARDRLDRGEISSVELTEAHLRQAERDIARYVQNPAGNAPKSIAPGWGARPRSRYPLSPGPPLGGGN